MCNFYNLQTPRALALAGDGLSQFPALHPIFMLTHLWCCPNLTNSLLGKGMPDGSVLELHVGFSMDGVPAFAHHASKPYGPPQQCGCFECGV